MKLGSLLLALLVAIPTGASAQTIDLGRDVSGYTRFVVYPHLQKGLEAMRRGDRDRAFAELEHARRLAPGNAPVAMQLAEAYRMFGQTERAESLLREQMLQTPDDARLGPALAQLSIRKPLAVEPLTAVPSKTVVPTPSHASTRARVRRPVPAPSERLVRAEPPVATPAPAPAALGDGFARALEAHRFDDAHEQAELLLAEDEGGPALLDQLTYQLAAAGAADQATRVLLRTYPFAGRPAAERDTLMQRLILLIQQRPGALTDEQLLPLRHPLDTPELRSRQSAFWASVHDCDAVLATLRDMASGYGHDDWMRLGDCATTDPALARQAYLHAQAIQPGGRASRALAFQSHGAGDFQAAVDQWRSVGADRLSGDDLLGAVASAVAAVDSEQATAWLETYRGRVDTLNHRYWSLVADNHLPGDPAAATSALHRAIDVHPEGDDYVRLARLEAEPARQVQLLERAAELDPKSGGTQAALGYAYLRGGQPAASLAAFERAGSLDPDNMNVQIELGYGSWRAGRAADAQRAWERAWHADPANLVLSQQLVYLHQRLHHNDEARWYAEQVLDAMRSSSAASPGKEADLANQRFGFERLHEDLDRRVTLSLDGFSGTSVGTAASGSQPGNTYRSYSQFEADVRLGHPPIRDGSTLSAYVRVLADGGDQRSALPGQNATLGLGLRWKPWRSQVVYLAAENQNGLADTSRRDFLLRASASFFGGGRSSDDWHPSGNGWISRNLYLDGAHYLQTGQSAMTADYRMSYHRKTSATQTIEPYGHLQLNGISNSGFQRDLRSGAGVRWNIWQGANAYDAAPHKISVGVEFQQAFKTYLADRNGLFLTFGTRW